MGIGTVRGSIDIRLMRPGVRDAAEREVLFALRRSLDELLRKMETA